MLNKRIGDRTVREIFEDLLGADNAHEVLTKIQNAYNDGVRGEELRIFAQQAIEEIPGLHPHSVRIIIAAIAIIVI